MYTPNRNYMESTIVSVRNFSCTRTMLESFDEGAGNDNNNNNNKNNDAYIEDGRWYNMQQQRNHNNKLLISGIPSRVAERELEDRLLKLFNAMNAQVDNVGIESDDIKSIYRIYPSGHVVCEFFDPENVYAVLARRRRVKRIDDNVQVYQDLCLPYQRINQLIVRAHSEGRIYRYRVWRGVIEVLLYGGDEFIGITHRNDLVELGIVDAGWLEKNNWRT